MQKLLKTPSAWIPFVLSFLALLLIVVYVSMNGVTSNPRGDEGIPARIFQELLAIQVPIIAYFGLTWLRKKPKEAIQILFMQLAASLVPIVMILLLES